MKHTISSIYFSPTKGTKKIVNQIACELGEVKNEYDITLASNRTEEINFQDKDLVVVGVPVYGGRIPLILEDYFNKIKGNDTLAVFTVVYGNRDYDDALLELRDVFESNGFICVAAGAFIGEHSYTEKVAGGRPDESDLLEAKSFAASVNEKIEAFMHDDLEYNRVNIKGGHPYKERKPMPPIAPMTNDKCTKCRLCAENCPVEAIDFVDFSKIDSSKCIKCCSCIKICPVDAKYFDNELISKITESLIENCSEIRKEPEVFF
ncbi:EFR1 family ferrodoxin [Alkalibacter mobilis]|uniref:EFR1 family ferrodoxin n=1 Tax=Alkalibacter mobilis TaxID=2787712 RepID=UPI00189DDF69|nr:EFR1 family ferrodoxin [Alkalibacter mobilis]MBF7097679.1 EFR1 family ferrodoxin [Alkalibacter mobilis]